MVAFAEVTSFVRYLADTEGPDALPSLLAALRDAPDADTALRESSGADLHTWDGRWRAYLAAQPHTPLPPTFGLGGEAKDLRAVRERLRLAELLHGRNHSAEALTEIEMIKSDAAASDPSVRHVHARILDALGRRADAERLVSDPTAVASSFGPWWAIRGRFQREAGQGPDADASFVEAVATDPLDMQSACEVDESVTETVEDEGPETAARALCDAAKARHEPRLGRD
jgi:predicted Zn-dependent protease